MAQMIDYLPQIEGEEATYIAKIMEPMEQEKAERFANVYGARRKDPQTVLLTALAGFLGVSGVHRFIIGQIGMGILYLLTFGLCFIGTIIDLINYKSLAFEYNREVARKAVALIE